MPEIQLGVGNSQVITVRLEPTEVFGSGGPTRPRLDLRFQMQLLPEPNPQGEITYTLLRLTGEVQTPEFREFAGFDAGPLAEVSNAHAFFRQMGVTLDLDRARIKKFEEARSGRDARLDVSFSTLLWVHNKQEFRRVVSGRTLQVAVPRSHWADQVLAKWNLSSVKLVEISFPSYDAGEHFRGAYARVEEAEKHFANGQYKEALTALRRSFEGLANNLGYGGRVKECIGHLLSNAHPEKRQKATEALFALYRFLHLGPHEQASQPSAGGEPVVLRQDARFALTMAHAIFEYITPCA